MKKTVLLVLSVLLIVLLASCTTFKADGLSSYTPKDYEVLGQFEESVTVNRFGDPPEAHHCLIYWKMHPEMLPIS